MPIDDHKFDEQFRDRLSRAEVQPPAEVWQRLAPTLPQRNNRRRAAWWWTSGIGALATLAIIFTLSHEVSRLSPKQNTTHAPQTTEINAIDTNLCEVFTYNDIEPAVIGLSTPPTYLAEQTNELNIKSTTNTDQVKSLIKANSRQIESALQQPVLKSTIQISAESLSLLDLTELTALPTKLAEDQDLRAPKVSIKQRLWSPVISVGYGFPITKSNTKSTSRLTTANSSRTNNLGASVDAGELLNALGSSKDISSHLYNVRLAMEHSEGLSLGLLADIRTLKKAPVSSDLRDEFYTGSNSSDVIRLQRIAIHGEVGYTVKWRRFRPYLRGAFGIEQHRVLESTLNTSLRSSWRVDSGLGFQLGNHWQLSSGIYLAPDQTYLLSGLRYKL